MFRVEEMNMSKVELKIADVAMGTIEVYGASKPILEKVADYMDSAEKLENSTLSGEEKFKWVLSYVTKEIVEIVQNLDYWIPVITNFINTIKKAYNILKHLFV